MSSRVDPTEWANRKKAAVERAKQIREDRKSGQLTENDTFQPQVNPRRPSSNTNANQGRSDSLDQLASGYRNPNDPMEQPLAAQRNRSDPAPYPLSPGSDALGKELKRHGTENQSNNNSNRYDSVNKKKADDEHKKKFLRQYEDSHAPQRAPVQSYGNDDQPVGAAARNANNQYAMNDNYNNNNVYSNYGNDDMPVGNQRNRSAPVQQQQQSQYQSQPTRQPQQQQRQQPSAQQFSQEAADDDFFGGLRDDNRGSRSAGPAWNSDTATDGFGAMPNNRTKTKPSRPAVQQATQQRRVQQQQDDDYYSQEPVRPPRVSPRNGDRVQPVADTVAQARPNLSLLKSKIRLSQGGSSNSLHNELPPPVDSVSQRRQAPPANNYSNSYYDQNDQELRSDSVHMPQRQPVQQKQQPTRRAAPPRQQQQQSSYQDEEADMDGDIMIAVPKKRSNAPASQNDVGYQPSLAQQQQQQQQQPPARSSRNAPPPNKSQSSAYYDEEPSYGARSAPVAAPVNNRAPQGKQFNGYDDPNAYPPNAYPPSGGFTGMDTDEYEDPNDGGVQRQCPDCGRRFNESAFEKHVKICAKVFLQKRKAFDSTKMRIGDDPELTKLYTKAKKEERRQEIQAKKQATTSHVDREAEPVGGSDKNAKWKQQSQSFREAMKAAREYAKAKESGAPLPPPVISSAPDPSLIPCPHCGRRFNDKAAERHIPKCQDIKAKPSSLKRGSGINASSGNAASSQKGVKGRGRF